MSKVLIIDASGYTSGINVPHAASRMIVEVVYPEQSQHKDHSLLQNREPLLVHLVHNQEFLLQPYQSEAFKEFLLEPYQSEAFQPHQEHPYQAYQLGSHQVQNLSLKLSTHL
jgi:hypothetical protein